MFSHPSRDNETTQGGSLVKAEMRARFLTVRLAPFRAFGVEYCGFSGFGLIRLRRKDLFDTTATYLCSTSLFGSSGAHLTVVGPITSALIVYMIAVRLVTNKCWLTRNSAADDAFSNIGKAVGNATKALGNATKAVGNATRAVGKVGGKAGSTLGRTTKTLGNTVSTVTNTGSNLTRNVTNVATKPLG